MEQRPSSGTQKSCLSLLLCWCCGLVSCSRKRAFQVDSINLSCKAIEAKENVQIQAESVTLASHLPEFGTQQAWKHEQGRA